MKLENHKALQNTLSFNKNEKRIITSQRFTVALLIANIYYIPDAGLLIAMKSPSCISFLIPGRSKITDRIGYLQ